MSFSVFVTRIQLLTPLRFTYVDVKPFALNLIDILLRKVEAAGTPEKVAENDLVMRC